MIKVKVYNSEGKPSGDISLEAKIFNVKVRPEVVQQAVRAQNANRRVVIAHTKDRSEVRGGGRKPWRQKGTGRARHGSIRSPIWIGGGVTFGPRSDRNYSLKMNKKARRNALFMALSEKVSNKKIIVIEAMDLPKINTKNFLKIINKLPVEKSILVVIPKADQKIVKSARNVPSISIIKADSLNIIEVLKSKNIVCLKKSLDVISKTYLK